MSFSLCKYWASTFTSSLVQLQSLEILTNFVKCPIFSNRTHHPGKQKTVADTLKRKLIECNKTSQSEGTDLHWLETHREMITKWQRSETPQPTVRNAQGRSSAQCGLRHERYPPYWNHRNKTSEKNRILLKEAEKMIVLHPFTQDT